MLDTSAGRGTPPELVRALGWLALVAVALGFGWLKRADQVDDASIYLRYARNVVEGRGWAFNAGEAVNGATSTGNTLLLVALSWLTGGGYRLAQVLLFGLGLGSAGWAVWWLCRAQGGTAALAVRAALEPGTARRAAGPVSALPPFTPQLPGELGAGTLAYLGLSDPATGLGGLIDGVVEKVDDHTVKLNLPASDIALIASFCDYPALIVHRSFDETGASLSQNPIGTGPWTLTGLEVGVRATYEKRTDEHGWWGDEVFGPVYLETRHERSVGPFGGLTRFA